MESQPPRRRASTYFVVLGYSTTDSARYGAYFDLVATHYRRRAPAYVLLCGGVTGKPETRISEAEWMAQRLEQRGIDRADLRLEERSQTTVENFLYARAAGLLPSDRPAVIFCDSYRRQKVLALAKRLDLEVEALVHTPMESPAMGRLVRVKSAVDAFRLRLLGIDSGRNDHPFETGHEQGSSSLPAPGDPGPDEPMRRQLRPSADARRQVELRALARRALARRRGALVACGEVTRDDVNRLSNLAQSGWVTAAFTAVGERLEDPVRRLVIEHQQRGYWCEAHDIATLAEVLPAEPYPTSIAFLHLKGDREPELTACLERLEPLVDVGGTVVLEDGGSAREAVARLAEARGLVPAAVDHHELFCWRRPGGDHENDVKEREEAAPADPRLGSGDFAILAYPEPPSGKFALLCRLGGFRVVRDLTRPFDLAIKWQGETTYTPIDRVLEELSRITPVVNLGCCDISKRRVEEAHREIFGYGLVVDPRTYRGPCVKKANLNAQNSESLVQCPLAPGDVASSDGHGDGFVYQRLVVTPREPEEYEEYRVPITGGEIPCVVIKRRPLSKRFDRCAGYAVLAEADEVFSAAEQSRILELCRVFGLDFGDLDILRERDDGRLHVIDVNPTPGGPGAAGYGYTEEQRQELLRRQLACFRRVFVDRLGGAQGSAVSQRDRS